MAGTIIACVWLWKFLVPEKAPKDPFTYRKRVCDEIQSMYAQMGCDYWHIMPQRECENKDDIAESKLGLPMIPHALPKETIALHNTPDSRVEQKNDGEDTIITKKRNRKIALHNDDGNTSKVPKHGTVDKKRVPKDDLGNKKQVPIHDLSQNGKVDVDDGKKKKKVDGVVTKKRITTDDLGAIDGKSKFPNRQGHTHNVVRTCRTTRQSTLNMSTSSQDLHKKGSKGKEKKQPVPCLKRLLEECTKKYN
jgi:hypothetical protein